MGFSDRRLAHLFKTTETAVRTRRHALGIRPVYKRVDTCAAEFATRTAYMYSTYEDECEAAPTDRKKIMVLGGGPNRIGQGIEFDYCCVHAAMALREDGFETIMVNCNPETVSTDYDTSDRLYFEPLTLEDVLEIVHVEKPCGVIVQFGGQTPLKLARDLEANGVPIIGTTPDMIDMAEDRERFQQMLHRAGAAAAAQSHRAHRSGGDRGRRGDRLPARRASVVRARRPRDGDRPRAARPRALHERSGARCRTIQPGAARPLPQRRDRGRRRRGVRRHATSSSAASWSTSSRPACIRATRRARCRRISLSRELQDELRRQTVAMAHGAQRRRPDERAVRDPDTRTRAPVVYVLEVNPRASRTVPYVSKATGRPLAKIAARCMVGQSLAAQGIAGEIVPPYFSVKEAVFPFIKFPGVDTILGPEMKSTGEVMGVGETFAEAFLKIAARRRRQAAGVGARSSSASRTPTRPRAIDVARMLARAGLRDRRHARHRGGARGGGRAGHAGQQGRRRPAAHRRHDRERRDRAGRQHRRGKALRRSSDSYAIRRAALHDQVPTFTTLAGARAAAIGMANMRELVPYSIQSLHASL